MSEFNRAQALIDAVREQRNAAEDRAAETSAANLHLVAINRGQADRIKELEAAVAEKDQKLGDQARLLVSTVDELAKLKAPKVEAGSTSSEPVAK